jgi:hypothetical protein
MRKVRRITNKEVYKIIKHIYNIKENNSLIVKCNVYIWEKVQPSPINEPMLTNHNSILAGLFSFVVQNPRAFVVFPT